MSIVISASKRQTLLDRLEGSNKYVPPYELEKMSYKGGREEGEKKGIEKGIKQGRQEGMQARNLEIAKQMLEDGEPIEKIQKWTGLSEEKISALK